MEAKATVVEYVRLVDEASKNPNGSEIPDEIAKYVSEEEGNNFLATQTILESGDMRVIRGETKVIFTDKAVVSPDNRSVTLQSCLDSSRMTYKNFDPKIISIYSQATWHVHKLDDGWILTETSETRVKSCGA